MARRMFYVDGVRDGRALLSGETAHHLRRVLRAEPGQRYEISDNAQLYLAEVEDFGKDRIEFRVVAPISIAPPPVRLHLLASLVKFDHFEWMLEKATELGVEAITPVYALRSDKGLDQAAVKRSERWQRIVLEAGQQSRRVTRPELHAMIKLPEALESAADVRLWLEEDRAASPLLSALPAEKAASNVVAILTGPEGGWDDREKKQAYDAGWSAVSLGPQILRAETASIAALSVVNAAWLAGAPR